MPLVPMTVSRHLVTGEPTMDHDVAAGTYDAAPTLPEDGFPIRREGGGAYDAFEMTYSFDATADNTTYATVRPWFFIPSHAPGGTSAWLSGREMESIYRPDVMPSTTADVFAPVRRINSVPTAATRMYLQVISIDGTAPFHLYMTVYGLSGIVANVDVGDIQVDIEPSGISIGAVKLEDGATTDKATVRDANVGGAPTDHVLLTQPLDAGGNVIRSSGIVGGHYTYSVNQGDLTATYATVETLTLAGLSFTPETINFMTVVQQDSTGQIHFYTPDIYAFGYVDATGILTVTGAAFAATDLNYDVILWGPPKGWTQATDSNRVEEIAPVNFAVTEETLVNTTNLAIATYSYPSDDGLVMLGSKNFSLTGQLICSGVMTMTVEVTNDPHVTPASRVWSVIYGFRADINAMTNSVGVDNSTQSFAWDFDGLNAKYVRVRVVVANATNTVKIFARRTAL